MQLNQSEAVLSDISMPAKCSPMTRALNIGLIALSTSGLTMNSALAQTTSGPRATLESIFNLIYGLVGVVAGIALLVTALNWKTGNWLGSHDPKKTFMTSVIGTGIAFGVVAIVAFIKASVSTGAGIGSV